MNITIEQVREFIRNNPKLKLLEPVPYTDANEPQQFPIQFADYGGDEIEIAILDLETTGLDCKVHEIIELGYIKALVSLSTGNIVELRYCKSIFEQPQTPITEEIAGITHITNEMVAGKRIPDQEVETDLTSVQLIIAHNANFDRGFFDKRFPNLANMPWACSIKDVDWTKYGLEGNKLLYLLFQCGYHYDAHRADIDCIATLRLFQENAGAMSEILNQALSEQVRIHCYTAPFRVKDALKERGYRWNTKADINHWYIDIPIENYEAERAWLTELTPNQVRSYTETRLTRFNRYKQS